MVILDSTPLVGVGEFYRGNGELVRLRGVEGFDLIVWTLGRWEFELQVRSGAPEASSKTRFGMSTAVSACVRPGQA